MEGPKQWSKNLVRKAGEIRIQFLLVFLDGLQQLHLAEAKGGIFPGVEEHARTGKLQGQCRQLGLEAQGAQDAAELHGHLLAPGPMGPILPTPGRLDGLELQVGQGRQFALTIQGQKGIQPSMQCLEQFGWPGLPQKGAVVFKAQRTQRQKLKPPTCSSFCGVRLPTLRLGQAGPAIQNFLGTSQAYPLQAEAGSASVHAMPASLLKGTEHGGHGAHGRSDQQQLDIFLKNGAARGLRCEEEEGLDAAVPSTEHSIVLGQDGLKEAGHEAVSLDFATVTNSSWKETGHLPKLAAEAGTKQEAERLAQGQGLFKEQG
jgi:hypothetical protein